MSTRFDNSLKKVEPMIHETHVQTAYSMFKPLEKKQITT